jgi:hypothetical protein
MCRLGRCTNPTSDKGCSIWVMVGSAMATAPRQMMLYSCRGAALQTGIRFLYSCITPLHVPSIGTHTLQRLYSSTASTALHPLQYTTLYNTPLVGRQPCQVRLRGMEYYYYYDRGLWTLRVLRGIRLIGLAVCHLSHSTRPKGPRTQYTLHRTRSLPSTMHADPKSLL